MFGSSAGARPGRGTPVAAPLEPEVARHGGGHGEQEDEQRRARRSSPRAPPPAQEPGERPQPVALGRERDMTHARRRERCDERAALVRGGSGEPLAQPSVARVDAKLPAGLRIDEPQLADVGELLLARVAHLDGKHGVPAREPQQRRPPVERAAEVGDDDDERALACATRSVSSSASRSEPVPAGGRSRSRRSVSSSARRPWRGRSTTGSAPNATVPSRLPRRVAA